MHYDLNNYISMKSVLCRCFNYSTQHITMRTSCMCPAACLCVHMWICVCVCVCVFVCVCWCVCVMHEPFLLCLFVAGLFLFSGSMALLLHLAEGLSLSLSAYCLRSVACVSRGA